ncbi:MAG: solute carrier family 23 protein, partial [Christensenellales bacterium]
DGIATMIGGLLGGPANTTYGENTAVLAITKNYNPKNIFYAACMAVVLGLFVPFGEILSSIPSPVVGGASIVLFGMISASGLRSLVDGRVDFNNSKNLIVVSITLAIGLGLGAMSLAGDITGDAVFKIMIGKVELSPLAIATLVGILLNLVIPNGKEDESEMDNAIINLSVSQAVDMSELEEKKGEIKDTEEKTEVEEKTGIEE